MNILITGSSGFMGKHLTDTLKRGNHHLVCLNSKNCNLQEPKGLQAFNSLKYDIIFHLAAWTQAGDFCLHHAGEQWIINQQINTNVLAWWNEFQPQAKIITIGTSCSYSPDLPLIEDNYLQGTPIKGLYTYAMTKRMLLIGLQSIADQFKDRRYLCVVPSTLYGPGYHTDGRQMHFIFDLIRKILDGKNHNKRVELWGDGTQRRELIHISDFIANMLNLNEIVNNDIVNLGAGVEYSIIDYAKEICNVVDFDFNKIEFDLSKYVGAKSKCLNIEKAKRNLHNYQCMEIKLGLKETVHWFEKTFYSV